MMNRQYKFSNKIRQYRISRGLTQEELGSLVGVSKNSISAFETGAFGLSAYVAARLCNVFRVKFEDLFSIEVF